VGRRAEGAILTSLDAIDTKPEQRAAVRTAALLAWAALARAAACDEGEEGYGAPGRGPDADPRLAEFPERRSPSAQLATVLDMRDDLAAPRHGSDGGGRAWLVAEESTTPVVISSSGRWTIEYEAGPEGIAEGGALFLLVPPFWGWDSPQARVPDGPGYTEVTTSAEGVELDARQVDTTLLRIAVGGRALRSGERVRIVYGAGPRGARADRFAERRSPLWLAVDGDGDGVRALVEDPPTLEIAAGPPADLVLTVPTTATVGEPARVVLAVLDARGNTGCAYEGAVVFEAPPPALGLPERVELGPGARAAVELVPSEPGLNRLRARLEPPLVGAPAGLAFESNPMLVEEHGVQVLWADLHGHSNLSDGTGTPEDYFRYARDVAGLDVVALTDHDHWGVRFLDQHPDMWDEIRATTERFHEPGRFVTLLGYEWTSWIYGHRHVLYFTDEGEVHSSVDPARETPRQLWDALAGQPALTFAHHSAGGPVATDWSWEPPPELEPVTEVVSVHGVSEAADAPGRIYRAIDGNFARDALDRGYRLGFVGSGDGHDGHPGFSHLASPQGGLAAIVAGERTREAVLEALRARRVYATNGARILLRTALDGRRMGSTIPHDELGEEATLWISLVGSGPVESLEVVRSGRVVDGLLCEGEQELVATLSLEGLEAGEYVYVRVVQEDRGMAWSSPFFVE